MRKWKARALIIMSVPRSGTMHSIFKQDGAVAE